MTKKFKNLLEDIKKVKYNNWVKPNTESLTHEYKIEYEIKPLKQMTGDVFPTLQSFLRAAASGKVISVTDSIDRKIQYRSRTKSREGIISLIKGYASYPQYRNEKTIDSIYKGFESNDPMSMPIVLQFPDGTMRIMGGNTRMDIAQHLGIIPKAFLIQIPSKEKGK